MNETTNPYQAPEANLVTASGGDWALVEPRRVPIGHGWKWIADAFRLFGRSPVIWILNGLIFMVITIVLSILPMVGLLATILMAIMTGGLMLGAWTLDREGTGLRVDHLFIGFRDRLGRLAAIGGLYLLATIVITAVVMVPVLFGIGFLAANNGEGMNPASMMLPMILFGLFIFLLSVPVLMAYWFAPSLAMLHDDVDAIRAMKLSLVGCLRNILPLIVYGLIMTLFFVLAAIPFFLGLLVMVPVMLASMYTGYRDIFVGDGDEAA